MSETKRHQANNLVPLDSELLAEYLFKTKEIQSTMLQSKTGCQFFADLVCAKFGKDNNEFGHSGDKTVSSYPEDNHQPPKERQKIQPCGCVVCSCQDDAQCHGCGAKNCGTKECVFKFHPENIKYKQPPKERKVSLEEIRQTIRQHGGWESSIDDISKAILSLLNATEERKGEE